MTDLQFDHTKKDTAEAMGLKRIDMKKFLLDLEEYMHTRNFDRHSHALEFVWASDQSFEMKILTTFVLGGITGRDIPTMIAGRMSDLPEELQKILKRLID